MKVVQFNVTVPQFLALKALGALNKNIYYSGPLATVHMADVSEPEIKSPDWVKIKVARCGICTSDINTILLNVSPAWSPYSSGPAVPGHEIAGTIVEVGTGVEGLRLGELVAVCPVLNCKARDIEPECDACKSGLATCENFAEGSLLPGMAVDNCASTVGGYGEYIIAHKSQIFKVPPGTAPETVALIEPFSIALEAVLANRPAEGDHVLVIGGGVIGTMIICAIRALDIPCKITSAVSSDFTGRLAKKSGADFTISGPKTLAAAASITGGKCYKPLLGADSMMGGFDRIYDCFSHSNTVDMAIRSLKTGGVISLIGISDHIRLDPAMLWLKLITLKSTLYYGVHEWKGTRKHVFDIAIDLISSKHLDLKSMVTHKFKLADYKKMMEVNVNKGKYKAIKTMFVYE